MCSTSELNFAVSVENSRYLVIFYLFLLFIVTISMSHLVWLLFDLIWLLNIDPFLFIVPFSLLLSLKFQTPRNWPCSWVYSFWFASFGPTSFARQLVSALQSSPSSRLRWVQSYQKLTRPPACGPWFCAFRPDCQVRTIGLFICRRSSENHKDKPRDCRSFAPPAPGSTVLGAAC